MAQEIEHKFLVTSDAFRKLATPVYYHQGYIPTLNGMTVRVRVAGTQGYLTFKDHAVGITRHEFEYPIPADEAEQLLTLMCAGPQIQKDRYVIPAPDGHRPDGSVVTGLHWEVDVFHGDNEGLIVAEIEVPTEDTQFDLPEWIGKEVTSDHRYFNSALCKHPYKEWNHDVTTD